MSDFTAVNAAAMQEGIQDLNSAHKSLTDHLDTLDGQLQGSLAKWDGAARSAYTTAKATWDKAARHMQEVIQKSGQVLSQITDNYDSNERKIQSSWS
jgi:WXG100 family type VII secretion target